LVCSSLCRRWLARSLAKIVLPKLNDEDLLLLAKNLDPEIS
jgi:hypothetical protein